MELARRYLGHLARGIEIGASAINPFPGVRAFNVDLPDNAPFHSAQQHIAGDAVAVHSQADAARLPFADGALDFVLASHVIEHMPDTLRALREWDRVVRADGVVFLIVPHRERTMDRDRPRTDWRHHLADYARRNDAARDPLVPTSHYHVWITEDFVALLERLNEVGYLAWELVEIEDVDSKVGNGFTVVARKTRVPAPVAPLAADREVAFHELTLDVPFQVIQHSLERVVAGPELSLPADLPRGTYRVTPILDGFPPTMGEMFRVEVGTPVPSPVIESYRMEDSELIVSGRDLYETTWLEGTYPDGTPYRLLPFFRDGELTLDTTGWVLPREPIPTRAVNPAPGGGPGPWTELRLRG